MKKYINTTLTIHNPKASSLACPVESENIPLWSLVTIFYSLDPYHSAPCHAAFSGKKVI